MSGAARQTESPRRVLMLTHTGRDEARQVALACFKALIAHAGLINLESQWATSDTVYGRELMNMGPVWEQGEVWRTQSPIRFAARRG